MPLRFLIDVFDKKVNLFEKLSQFFWDSTVGLLQQYQKKTVELARIEALAFYVRTMQAIRRHIILFLIGMFFLMMLAVGLLVLPIALVLCLPWSTTAKVSVIAGLGAVYITLPAVALSWVLSEKRWMRFTMAEEWLSKVTDGS